MTRKKKWDILGEIKNKNEKIKIEEVIDLLLENRGIKTEKEREEFLHTDTSSVTSKSVGIDSRQLTKALKRIEKAMLDKEQIVVFGDYDVDGITGTAILWETLYAMGAMVVPYIPSRMEEGYGLSIAGITNLQSQISNIGLIVTVDNGIVANDAVDFADSLGIDVIVTDHHTIGKELPKAHAIVHTTQVCGAGVGYLLSQELRSIIARNLSAKEPKESEKEIATQTEFARNDRVPPDHLSLVALATVADLVPLTGANRVLLRYGLEELRRTSRPGLLALFKTAEIEKEKIGVYEIGHIIAPRLNAMGRLESAMDSLRLLCTKDRVKAMVLADMLQRTNTERQLLTRSAAEHAIQQFHTGEIDIKRRLLFIAHEEYEEGIIGLVAGKLVEEFYLPAIVLSKGEKVSKASARSIAGFNIIEFIRTSSELLLNAGGHPMAAGFSIETAKIDLLQEALETLAQEQLDEELLQRVLRIDCELPLPTVTEEFYQKLQVLSPFGMANLEPTFMSNVKIEEVKTVGKDKKHLKLRVSPTAHYYSSLRGVQTTKQSRHSGERSDSRIDSGQARMTDKMMTLDAIGFGLGDRVKDIKVGSTIDIAYTISENIWNGRKNLQLKLRDIK